MQLFDRHTPGPQQTPAQGARRLLVRIDPRSIALNESGPAREALGPSVSVAPLPSDEGTQLGLAEAFPPMIGGYFFFPPRAP